MTDSIRYSYDGHFVVNGSQRLWVSDLGFLGAPLEVIGNVSLLHLQRSLGVHADAWGQEEVEVLLSEVPAKGFDDEESPFLSARIVWTSNGLLVEVFVDDVPDGFDGPSFVRALEGVISRWRASVVECDDEDPDAPGGLRLRFNVPLARRVVADIVKFGAEILHLADVLRHGGLDQGVANDLLDARFWDLFIGSFETDWLETKRQHYASGPEGEIALASDIAAFGNATGGLLIVGMKTTTTPDGDIIKKVNRCPLSAGVGRRYARVIERRVYPVPRGIVIRPLPSAEARGEGLLVIEVPEQAAGTGPFMVRGGIERQRVLGSFIGIPVRRGDETRWWDARDLYGHLRRQ